MKKTIIAIASVVALIGVSAPVHASVSTSVSAVQPANAKDDRMFYTLVTKEAPSFKAISRRELVKTAKQTCKFLRSGFGILDVVEIMEDSGFSSKEATAFVAGAVVFYCPSQKNNY
jgi:hypothetical protein